MATSIITISTKTQNVEDFESLKMQYDTDLSKIIVALVLYAHKHKEDKNFLKEIDNFLKK